MKRNYKRFCKEPEKIENFEKADADNFIGWECHHRLETHTSDGERRLVDITAEELKALGMYWNRPPEELIFLTVSEHNSLHKKGNTYTRGRHHSEESKKKMSLAKKGMYIGEKNPFYGKTHSEETRRKLSEAAKNMSEETKKKIGAAQIGNTNVRGTRWFNNGKINKRANECPPGFVPGMLK